MFYFIVLYFVTFTGKSESKEVIKLPLHLVVCLKYCHLEEYQQICRFDIGIWDQCDEYGKYEYEYLSDEFW